MPERIEHQLLKLNVNNHTEKKQGLTYLSWAWAWATVLANDPLATFSVHTFEGKPYMDVNGTGMVWVTVTIKGMQRTCFLPVMNHRNQAIQNPDAFQVNTAIMRCMTKCLALFGLGLYIYAGEDLPEDAEAPKEAPKEPAKAKVAPAEKIAQAMDKELPTLELFAEGLIKYVEVCTDEKALKSYWKANQTQIDRLKQLLPDEYAKVLERFQKAKSELTKEVTNG